MLASNSPRRRELLALTGWTFQVRPASIDESVLPGEAPAAYVLRLAVGKARAAAQMESDAAWVIGSDTTVANGEEILGKPAGAEEAADMLRALRGHAHTVYTAVALVDCASGLLETEVCATAVPMRAYSEAEIDAYVASGDPLDKAGAYAIQHPGFHPVERLEGCFASVMGLPLCHLQRAALRLGRAPMRDVPAACRQFLEYACPIYSRVLAGEDVG